MQTSHLFFYLVIYTACRANLHCRGPGNGGSLSETIRMALKDSISLWKTHQGWIMKSRKHSDLKKWCLCFVIWDRVPMHVLPSGGLNYAALTNLQLEQILLPQPPFQTKCLQPLFLKTTLSDNSLTKCWKHKIFNYSYSCLSQLCFLKILPHGYILHTLLWKVNKGNLIQNIYF